MVLAKAKVAPVSSSHHSRRDKTPVKFNVWLTSLIEASNKQQNEIAREIGYDKPNIISMFKQGLTKVPIPKIGPLAKSLEADPALMLRLAMREYMPESWEAIEDIMGTIVTANEVEILKTLRTLTHDTDPALKNTEQKRLLKQFAESLM